jgi:uncharacterized protein YfdQ (DUF2303 family)
MDSSAINAIRDLTAADRANASIYGDSNVSIPLVVVPENHKLLDLERYTDQPARFRGHFSTRQIQEFIEYINDKGGKDTGIFVNPEDAEAKAIMNMGFTDAPLWGDHTASLLLKKQPEFAALLDQQNKRLTQQDFIDFAEDWQDHIIFVDDQDVQINSKAAINAIRRITVSATQNSESSVGNFSASQSSMDAIEVKAAGATPPYGFKFLFNPYESFQSRIFTCQLRAITDGKSVSLKYRIVGLDQHINSIGVEFKELLEKSITETGVGFYTGTMQYQK